MRRRRRLDGGDPRLEPVEPVGECAPVFRFGQQRQVRHTHEKGVRYRVRLRDERERGAGGDRTPRRGGTEDATPLRGGGRLGVHQPAFFQLGEQVVDRREPDLGPLPYPAAFDDLFEIVTVLRGLDDQAEDDEFGRSELHGAILALE